MTRRVVHIFLVLLTGCFFMLNGAQDVHAEILAAHKHQVFEQSSHAELNYLDHQDKDNPQNLYCRMRTRADVQQNHYLYDIHSAPQILEYPEQPEELISVRIQTSNEYFRSFLKRLLFPKHSFW